MKQPVITPIVVRALVDTITDIGQLSQQEKLELNRALRFGLIVKGQGGPFPTLKTVYAHPHFNFDRHRAQSIAEMGRASTVLARGITKQLRRKDNAL